MKKISVLLLASLFAVPACRASSIDYDTGVFRSGTLMGSFLNGSAVNVSIKGSLNTIALSTGALTQFTGNCPATSMCFSFTSGTVQVMSGSGSLLFTDTLSGGLAISSNGSASLNAVLTSQNGISLGSAAAVFDVSGKLITSGSEDVTFNRVVPEPSTLMLFGAGLVGLGARFRHRINF